MKQQDHCRPRNFFRPLFRNVVMLLVLGSLLVSAKTRFSALHFVPDADFIMSGNYVLDAQGYFFNDSSSLPVISPTILFHTGITEWVNLHLGYAAGGFTCGFKARILGETKGIMPSLAIGSDNIFVHREVGYFNHPGAIDTFNNEFFLALAKTIDPIKTRIHLGMLSMPTNPNEKINGFVAIEKYFGAGIYTTFELFTREKDVQPCLFVSWRLLRQKNLEIWAGAVDIKDMLVSDEGKFSFSMASSGEKHWVRPGLFFGLRFLGAFGKGSSVGFKSVEDRFALQDKKIDVLAQRLDTLTLLLKNNFSYMSMKVGSLSWLSDSLKSDKERLKVLFLDKLYKLKSLYASEPFDPAAVRTLTMEICGYRERAVPTLLLILCDNTQDKTVRTLCANVLGEIGSSSASATLLEVLSQTADPELKIEIIISLGKIGETRAIFMLEQLANDPDDAIAYASQEVLGRFQKNKGVKLTGKSGMRNVVMPETSAVIYDRTIGKAGLIQSSALSAPGPASIPVADTITKSNVQPVKQTQTDTLSLVADSLKKTLTPPVDSAAAKTSDSLSATATEPGAADSAQVTAKEKKPDKKVDKKRAENKKTPKPEKTPKKKTQPQTELPTQKTW